MKRIAFLAVCVAAVLSCRAVEWKGIDEASWRSGPKLTPESLKGKVVLVDKWGVSCPPCRQSLPHMEELWQKFRSRPFVVIGSHCQGGARERLGSVVAENGLTYSNYQAAGIADEPIIRAIPFFYIVNHEGRIVYQSMGFGEARAKELEEEVEKALDELAKSGS